MCIWMLSYEIDVHIPSYKDMKEIETFRISLCYVVFKVLLSEC